MLETIVHLTLEIALIGLFAWGIVTVVPMPDKFKQVINVVAVIGAVLVALHAFGFVGNI